jgi:pyruvate,water dikinase
MRRALLEAGRRLAERGILREGDDVFFLNLTELGPVLAGRVEFDVPVTIAERKAEFARNLSLTPPPVIVGRFDPDRSIPIAIDETAKLLKGLAVSPGVVTGRARVILRADAEARVLPGEILVAPFTDPGWTPYFLPAAAIVVDLGGQLTHGSVVAREYGIPAVVNVGSATRIIRTGQVIQVDGNRGVVTILSEGEEQAEAIPLTAAGAQRGMDGA